MTAERLAIENTLMIADKEKNDVPFIFNHSQAKLDDQLTGRDIVPKARQEGVSSYVLALFLIRCLHVNNTRAVVISHDQESTERLFKRVKYYLDNFRGPKAVIETSSKRELTFPKTNSVFYIGTAGARKFGRGDTITDLHCSEVAFWENPKELTSGLFQAVPRTGTIILESTGNGRNWFYRRVMKALDGKGRYTVHFLNWQDFPEYDLELTDDEEDQILATLDPELEEDRLYEQGLLTLGQIQFRREKLEELDYDMDLFKQEYPMTIDECFKATGRSVFHKVNYYQTPLWKQETRDLYLLSEHPKAGGLYIIGADVAGGVGQDNSVAQIVDLEEQIQVGEWVSNSIAPDIFAVKLKELGEKFNQAYIVVESNNHGIMTLGDLRKIYSPHLVHKKRTNSQDKETHILNLGLRQTSRTKPLTIGMLRKAVATWLTVCSPRLKDEMDTFIETPDGKLEAEEGANDDRVLAMACVVYGFQKAQMKLARAPMPEIKAEDPFLLDTIIDELHSRKYEFPIARQIRGKHENIVSRN